MQVFPANITEDETKKALPDRKDDVIESAPVSQINQGQTDYENIGLLMFSRKNLHNNFICERFCLNPIPIISCR